MHEVRFDGAFVHLFETEDEAGLYVASHLDATHRKRFSIAPAKRFHVRCRGNLVDTCESAELAAAVVEKNATDDAPADCWTVDDTDAAPPTPREEEKKPYVAPHVTDLSPQEAEVISRKARRTQR